MSKMRLAASLAGAAILGIAVVAALAIGPAGPSERTAEAAPPANARNPNFVFVLTDDLARNLVPYMKQVQAMKREGTSFSRYFLTDSLCCPSRSSIFTGRYPHSTGVITNKSPDGGFGVFHKSEEKDTFATSLQADGYDTAMMGKYLNGYKPMAKVDGKPRYVPPGWSAWSVAGNGYPEFDYNLLQKGVGREPRVVHYGKRPQDYLTDVISARGRNFMGNAVKRGRPFMLELATFAPHGPFTPAPRDAHKFPNARVPRTKLFNRAQVRKGRPKWLSTRRLTKAQIQKLDRNFRKRARAVQAVDKMIADVRAELTRLGVADNTYIVFTADNGFHMGQRRLLAGKQTAWDHDIRVPMVVVGPGVRKGKSVSSIALNTDLRPTFQRLAGLPVSNRVEGRSLTPFLRGDKVKRWRKVTIVEHHGPNNSSGDPDKATKRQGNPPSYKALRFRNSLYVQYDKGRKYRPEYYNLRKDRHERRNVYYKLARRQRSRLRKLVRRFHACEDGKSCRKADRG